MPRPRKVLNAFTAKEVRDITGLTLAMINYLSRMDFLVPAYGGDTPGQGRVRYYSYRDLVVARLIRRLRLTGVGLVTIKAAVVRLRSDDLWEERARELPSALSWLKTDGRDVFIERADGFLEFMRGDGQGAFGFLVNLGSLASEVRAKIPPGDKLDNFTMHNRPLMEPPTTPAERRRRS
jgi:DNA-binding transcriptional MerR regulator